MLIRTRIAIMQFLQFYVWAAWMITIGAWWFHTKHWSGAEFGAMFSTMGIASLFMPAVAGIIADRYISAERLYGMFHLCGAALLFYIPQINNPTKMFWIMLINMCFYMPTIPLSISISFSLLKQRKFDIVKEYPPIRVLGTVGFILAMWTISLSHLETSHWMFYVAGIASTILGLYGFSLPNCPPLGKESGSWSSAFGIEAFKLFKNKEVALFLIFSMLLGAALQLTNAYGDAFLHSFSVIYRSYITVKYPAIILSISQISEVSFLFAIPFMFRRFGIKKIMLISMVAWVLRFGLFGFGNPGSGLWMIVLSCMIYGMAFDFFNVSGQLYIENQVDPSIRASAQGLFMLMTNGIGAFLGSYLSGLAISKYYTHGAGNIHWQGMHGVWVMFATYAAIIAILFVVMFKSEPIRTPVAAPINTDLEY
ncbi:MAG: nucleoside permease [Gammaproteobacteria bacterium]|nr:nucleoside permease [Gammaproteobacteria bacterium]